MKTLLIIILSSLLCHISIAQSSLALDLFNGASFSEVSVPTGANSLLGFSSTGEPARITLGTGLTMTAGTLNAAGGGTWGSITGTLSSQSDLGVALAGRYTIEESDERYQFKDARLSEISSMVLFNVTDATLLLNPGATITDPAVGSVGIGGAAGQIIMTGGNGFADTSTNFDGGAAGQLFMNGSAATALAAGAAAGLINTSASGEFAGGSLNLSSTGTHNGGSISTLAGGSLTMGSADLTGPEVAGTILTTDGDGSGLTALNASQLTTGTVPNARLSAVPNSALANSSITINGSAVSLGGSTTLLTPTGNGSGLTALNASQLTTGTISTARLPTTITGLSSVTSTSFVGALTGTASGNATLGANTFTGTQTVPSHIISGLSLTGSQATNTVDVSTTWNTSGNPSLFYGRATNTASGASARLIDVGTVSGGSLFSVSKAGAVTSASAVTGSAAAFAQGVSTGTGGNGFWFTGGGFIICPSAGIFKVSDNTDASFNRLQLGGTTSSYPAIKRSAATVAIRLADDSADAGLTASTITASGAVTVGSGTAIARIKHGTVTLIAGTVTVSDSAVVAGSRIFINRQTDGGTVGDSYSITRSAGVSFTITSKTANATASLDTSTLSYLIINP